MEKINLYVAVEQMKRITISGGNFSEMEPADTGRQRHGDTHGRPFEEKGDG